MNDTITISKADLEKMIAEAISKNSLPRQKKDFRDVHLTYEEVEKINLKHPLISERLSRKFASQITDEPSIDELRFGRGKPNSIYTRKRYGKENSIGYEHHKIYLQDILDNLKRISLAVMGASIIKDLDDDEFEYSLVIYEEFKKLFLNLYDKRLSIENKILENMEWFYERNF